MQFWVFRQVWQADQVPPGYGPWVQDLVPPAVCLNPGEQEAVQVDPRVQVAAVVRRDWRTFGLPPGVVQVRPQGQTLVGAPTKFSTDTPPSSVLRRTVLGLPVTLTVQARSYTWTFGDGTTARESATGALPATEHVFARTGAVAATLTIVYGGSFTIGDDPAVYDVEGTATIPGPEEPLGVRQARTQLEAD